MIRIHPLWTALVLVAAYGVWDGFWTNRWSFSDELEVAVSRMENIPMHFGDWQGEENNNLDPKTLKQGEISGYICRKYTNARHGVTLSVLMICGEPGPTSVHTPDVCYQGAGFFMIGQEKYTERAKSSNTPVEIWKADFKKPASPFPEQLRIYWTWSANGKWETPGWPRLHFASSGVLYKMYIIRHLWSIDESSREDPSLTFLNEFLPVVNATIFPSAKKS